MPLLADGDMMIWECEINTYIQLLGIRCALPTTRPLAGKGIQTTTL